VPRASKVEKNARALCAELARVTDNWPELMERIGFLRQCKAPQNELSVNKLA
jgi:hypothetical protein